jgi:hypothetical protein
MVAQPALGYEGIRTPGTSTGALCRVWCDTALKQGCPSRPREVLATHLTTAAMSDGNGSKPTNADVYEDVIEKSLTETRPPRCKQNAYSIIAFLTTSLLTIRR